MGQTLSHGVYLPNEGERNCYAGLASNWQILNTAVGNIAEKAPLVHTHGNITNDGKVGTDANKPLITGTGGAVQAGAFGNQANTFCEGNDSRLSDARTPVAHTHTKSDVTDLFNSANTWTGANTFSDSSPIRLKNDNIEKGVQPTVFQAQNILFKDKNNSDVANIRHIVTASGTNNNADGLEFSVANKFANGALDPTGTNTVGTLRIGFWTDGQKYIYNEFRWRSSLIPFNNQTQDIGSSSYQWNNLYAKNYYYNGVVWGLDKENTWTQSQTIKNTEYQIGETPSAAKAVYINFTDKNNVNIGWIQRRIEASGDSSIELFVYNRFTNSQPDPAGTTDYAMLKVGLKSDQTHFCEITGDAYPRNNNAYNLGTSSKKWKTLNGVNPGSLSLPDYDETKAIIVDTTGWTYDGSTANQLKIDNATQTINGWLFIRIENVASTDRVIIRFNGNLASDPAMGFSPVSTGINLIIPIPANKITNIYLTKSPLHIKFYPCLGNA